MTSLLFLLHRIPYPPNKGDKIRSYQLLRRLSQRYAVHLAAFVDDPEDLQHEQTVRELCAGAKFARISPFWARLRSSRALLGRAPLSLSYYRSSELQRWVATTLSEQGIRRIVVFSSVMAQYVMQAAADPDCRAILDFVDVDSDKWRQYSLSKGWPLAALYSRESKALQRFERKAAAVFDLSVFVSRSEAELFRRLAPESARRVTFVENGVDTDYFSPQRAYPNPYREGGPVFVFTGAMDYWANVDAVTWFASDVFPAIRRHTQAAQFYVVGIRPTEQVRRLAQRPGITVTGAVDDVRPYLAHARAAVAPLRIARGVQNKVLEAMAMARPILVSEQALEGLDLASYPLLARGPQEWIDLATKLLDARGESGAEEELRQRICRAHDWSSKVDRFCELLESGLGADPHTGTPAARST
jgi:sugar transferase (PEP-CTERM/EpsH1 system associated)